jgi:hypothetical protein
MIAVVIAVGVDAQLDEQVVQGLEEARRSGEHHARRRRLPAQPLDAGAGLRGDQAGSCDVPALRPLFVVGVDAARGNVAQVDRRGPAAAYVADPADQLGEDRTLASPATRVVAEPGRHESGLRRRRAGSPAAAAPRGRRRRRGQP